MSFLMTFSNTYIMSFDCSPSITLPCPLLAFQLVLLAGARVKCYVQDQGSHTCDCTIEGNVFPLPGPINCCRSSGSRRAHASLLLITTSCL